MVYVATAFYVMGAYLYYLHQLTIVYLQKIEEVSMFRVYLAAILWPVHVLEAMIFQLFNVGDDDEE